jgi:protein with PEP-CTERM/exosortase system signal
MYGQASGPTSFGIGGGRFANSGNGDLVGIEGIVGFIFVPQGYVSGSPLSDSATYNSATFSSLGVTPGIYEWAWGTGLNQNFTLDAVAAPDSGSTLALLAIALGGLFGVSRFRSLHLA